MHCMHPKPNSANPPSGMQPISPIRLLYCNIHCTTSCPIKPRLNHRNTLPSLSLSPSLHLMASRPSTTTTIKHRPTTTQTMPSSSSVVPSDQDTTAGRGAAVAVDENEPLLGSPGDASQKDGKALWNNLILG